MTKFNLGGANLVPSKIYTPSTSKKKYPKARAIAAAYWISYFALHWLLILEVIELTTARGFCTTYFLLSAIVTTFMIVAHEATEAGRKKNE